jgi:hypothetical protein
MHRWVRGITVGAGGAALLVATFGAGLSPAGADDDPEADADAAVWNDQYATVDIETGGEASSGDNTASSFNGNVVLIGQGARADAELLSESRDEILAWFTAEGFADWMGAGGFIDTGFNVIPGSPVVLPVLGGSATNLIESINNTAAGIAEITAGAAGVSNTTGVTLGQDFSGNGGADATADATSGDANATANASVNNSQRASVGVSSGGSASSGGNRATTANGNAVVIGQGASANASGSFDGNSDGSGSGDVSGGTASNTVGSVTNTAQGQASISTGAATVSNNTTVNVTQSNTGNGGATSSATAEGGEAP